MNETICVNAIQLCARCDNSCFIEKLGTVQIAGGVILFFIIVFLTKYILLESYFELKYYLKNRK